jgi:hypothetical protein
LNTPSNPGFRIRAALVAGASLALVAGVSACGGGGGGEDGPGSKQLDLVIGNVLPLSGTSKQLGESGEKASDLAVGQIKAAIEESGADHSVRAISQDEGADADAATVAVTALAIEGAGCLTGPWSSVAVEQTANDVAIPDKTPMISPVPASEGVTELSDHDLVNSTALPVSTEGTALADAIEQALGGADGSTVDVASSDDEYGDGLSQDFVQDWQDRDGTVGSGSGDATLLIADPTSFSQLVSPLLSGNGWNPESAWGSDQLVNPGLPEQVGTNVVTGMRALAPGSPTDGETGSAFAQPFAAQEFDATVLCYLAAVAAGSTDGREMADELIDITAPGGDEFTWRQLPAAIEALEKGEDIDYTGASGPLDLDVHGNATSGVFDVYRYTGSGLEVVDEVPVEKPNPATP